MPWNSTTTQSMPLPDRQLNTNAISNPLCVIARERFCSQTRNGGEGVAGLRLACVTKPAGKTAAR